MNSLCLRCSTESFATATHVAKKMNYHPQTEDLFSVPELFINCDGSTFDKGS